MSLRTPLKRVRYLGSAKEGADHFWKQRVTAVSNLVLSIIVVALVVSLAGADHGTVVAALKRPEFSLPLILLVVSGVIHMRLGMQTIIEDYVHGEAAKITLLMLNTFFAIAVGAASILAVMRIYFGA
ncbi:MAG: succinate dehydrogenase, hydrophobic membrane anchor protein [Hyphomicrobium sp.]|nr:succinate dehydrogenase, hydrophobic membrane anchor protein [Hyphomicrobium sp.]